MGKGEPVHGEKTVTPHEYGEGRKVRGRWVLVGLRTDCLAPELELQTGPLNELLHRLMKSEQKPIQEAFLLTPIPSGPSGKKEGVRGRQGALLLSALASGPQGNQAFCSLSLTH